MNAAEHDRNHELLCAWILGEASAEEAREVELALAASPELRAERERLEQTILLVQDSLSGDAKLSEESMASLLTAAADPSRGSGSEAPIYQMSWYRHPALKAAAAVTVMLGGVLGILNIEGGSSPSTDTARSAHSTHRFPVISRPRARRPRARRPNRSPVRLPRRVWRQSKLPSRSRHQPTSLATTSWLPKSKAMARHTRPSRSYRIISRKRASWMSRGPSRQASPTSRPPPKRCAPVNWSAASKCWMN